MSVAHRGMMETVMLRLFYAQLISLSCPLFSYKKVIGTEDIDALDYV